jgi:hypothetical protein
MMSSGTAADALLFSEAIAALRELVSRTRGVHDRSFDDGHSVDAWQSDELSAAIQCAEAVIAKSEASIAASPSE